MARFNLRNDISGENIAMYCGIERHMAPCRGGFRSPDTMWSDARQFHESAVRWRKRHGRTNVQPPNRLIPRLRKSPRPRKISWKSFCQKTRKCLCICLYLLGYRVLHQAHHRTMAQSSFRRSENRSMCTHISRPILLQALLLRAVDLRSQKT